MSLTKLSLAGNTYARESLVSDIPAGDSETANLFYSVNTNNPSKIKHNILRGLFTITNFYKAVLHNEIYKGTRNKKKINLEVLSSWG